MCFYEAQTYPCRKHVLSYTFYYECSWLTTRRLWSIYNNSFSSPASPTPSSSSTFALGSDSASNANSTLNATPKPPAHKSGYHGQTACGPSHTRSRFRNIVVVEKPCPTCGTQPNESPVGGWKWRFVRGEVANESGSSASNPTR